MHRAIIGGTFDPPHLAHLIAAESAVRQLGLDEVRFMPAGAPWQKAHRGVSDADHRWRMTQLAIEGVDYFVADDREVRRDGWTYTADTLDELGFDDVVLILGADAAANLPTWHRYESVLSVATIAVAPRPGTSEQAVRAIVPDAVWLDMPLLDLSGTTVRERARSGRPYRFLVREAVYHYIDHHQLYA